MKNNDDHGDFFSDKDYLFLSSPQQGQRPTEVEDIAELIWQNGQVVTQSQNNRPASRKTPQPATALSPGKFHQQNLYMQDDDMNMMLQCPWGQYSTFQDNEGFCNDFLFNPGSSGDVTTENASIVQNIDSLRMLPPLFSFTTTPSPSPAGCPNLSGPRMSLERRGPGTIVRESTVVDSCATPSLRDASAVVGSATFAPAANSNTTANREAATWEITTTSSTGGSSTSAQPPRVSSPYPNRDTVDKPSPGPSVARKRKPEDTHAEKPARCTKRTRAAEVHNLSERRRRDRINEKMRALQELIPRCNKSDKASMLDEAIEYLKSLQLQVQIMAMGCGMVPMVFPGMQQFLPAMGMGSPVMPFPNFIPAAASTAANLSPRFPHPAFHYPPMAAQEPIVNNQNLQSSNMMRIPTFADAFQQNVGAQLHNQTTMHANNGNKASSSRAVDNRDKNQQGAAL